MAISLFISLRCCLASVKLCKNTSLWGSGDGAKRKRANWFWATLPTAMEAV